MDEIIGLIGLIGVIFVVALVHELGHIVANLIVRIPMKKVQFGWPVLVRFSLLETSVEVGLLPFFGLVEQEGEFEDYRWEKRLISLLAGPMASFALAAAIYLPLYLDAELSKAMISMLDFMATNFRQKGLGGSDLFLIAWILSKTLSAYGIVSFAWFIGSISLSVAFLNLILFPIPITDGAGIVLALTEGVTGKRLTISKRRRYLILYVLVGLSIAWILFDTVFR